jgi:predicted dehydrogenase
MDKIRWGILGTGNIARQFARGLKAVDDGVLTAVGSRTQEAADKFGDEYRAAHRHASYEALANDPEVEVIYISTPHPFHYENMLLCLNAGKHVLCEKPFAMNTRQAREAVALARSKKLFLMEAMWTRYVPAVVQAKRWVDSGAIGDVKMVQADLCFRATFNPEHRLFNPALGGGALLDVGIYPLSFASFILGAPESIQTRATMGATGVDEQNAMLLGYKSGAIALLSSAVHTSQPIEAMIAGDTGTIRLAEPFFRSDKVTLIRPGQSEEVRFFPHKSNGYEWEAMEVQACLRAGKLESAIMPLDETLQIMQTMDAIRAQWGLTYPNE